MKKGLIIFVVIVVLLSAAAVAILYYTYEKPKETQIQQSQQLVAFNIFAKEKNQNVVTDYQVIVNGANYTNGTTLTGGAIQANVPLNSTIEIYNINREGQNYYTTLITKQLYSDPSPQRTEINLEKRGALSVVQNGSLYGEPISLNVTSDGLYKNLGVCIKWSIHIITVQTGLPEQTKPEAYKNYDRCFDTQTTLNSTNSSYTLNLNYKFFDKLNGEDFINLVFYDKDCFDNRCFNMDSAQSQLEYGINNI